jgi:hypothetical protein
MANRPANAGSSGGQAPLSHTPLPPRPPAGHRATRPKDPKDPKAQPGDSTPNTPNTPNTPSAVAWIPYLIVLAGVAIGLYRASQSSKYAGWGAGLVGCSLLAAALARLVLPPRYGGLLASRRKVSDVLAFATFGAGVLAVALILPS